MADRRQLVYTYRACCVCNDEIKTVTDEVEKPVILCFDCDVMFKMQFRRAPSDDDIWNLGLKYGVYGIMEPYVPMYQPAKNLPPWAADLDKLREEYWDART